MFKRDQVILISEQYVFGREYIEEMLRLCDDYNLDIYIDAGAFHNPGGCTRIMFAKKEE